jgi:hypothetical protein
MTQTQIIASPLALSRRRWQPAAWLALAVLACAVSVLFATSPQRGDFWWSDAPRHAIDGVFYYDLLKDLPISRLKEYAMDYYVQYPALTILFYPPMFPAVEAIFFAIFGVSHFTAQLAVAFFYLWAVWGAYALSRLWFSRLLSFSVALAFAGMPEVALWGRQVMLEIPACAFLFWACYALLRYLDSDNRWWLYLCAALLVGGIYTKQTVGFVLPVFLWMIWRRNGKEMVRDRRLWITAALLLIAIAPLALVSLRFGHVNVNSVVGGSWNAIPVFSLKGWLFYAQQLPSQIGWPATVLAAVYLAVASLRREWRAMPFPFLFAWVLSGYVLFSLIALKEPRHTILILLPLAFFAVHGLHYLIARIPGHAVGVAGCAILMFAHTIASKPVPAVAGYDQAVDYIARHAPPNSVVLFSGYRDGSFIFNMRAREDRRDVWVLRSDKLLLRVTQRRELGVQERGLSDDQILDIFHRYGVNYVVTQPNFWDDLASMRQFQKVLESPQFQRVAVIPVRANVAHQDHKLEIYENRGPQNVARQRITLDLPIIGLPVEGRLGTGVPQ